MKNFLRVVAVTILCLSVISPYARTGDKSPQTRNYADILANSVNVINPNNAVDVDLTNYAVMQTAIGVANRSVLKLGWSQQGDPGQTALVEIQNDGGVLSLDLLQSLTVVIFDAAGNVLKKKSNFDFGDLTVGDDPARYKIQISATDENASIASIRLTLMGAATLQNRLRVYYAYLVTPCTVVHGDGIFAQHNVQDAANAISASTSDFATLTPPLALGNSYLDLSFSQPQKGGKVVSFHLGEGNTLLSASLLQNITLTAYDTDGGVVASKSGFALADAQILPNGRFNLPLHTPKGDYQIARGRITFTGLANLTTLKVYTIVMRATCAAPVAVVAHNANPLSGIQVYPNPFRTYTTLNVKGALNSKSHIVISDKTGNIIEERTVTGAASIRLLEKASSGIYFIKIITGDLIETRTVVKL